TEDGICMVEGGGQEVSEERMLKAITTAEVEIKKICDFLKDFAEKCGKTKLPFAAPPEPLDLTEQVKKEIMDPMSKALFTEGKDGRHDAVKSIKKEYFEKYKDQIPEGKEKLFYGIFEDVERNVLRNSILNDDRRCDGRKSEDIRKITSEIGMFNGPHGSALFTRGETQSLGTTTLGTVFDEQIMDDIDGDRRSSFMLHYNFPPYSVGETGRLGTGRREIGHGHLAQRAIEGVLPAKDEFPYTIRVVSEILESNGSSSQATVCSASMSLQAAGVPLKKPVAGIAMGLITDGTNFKVLSDILGEEDHMGDMDFKVAGSEEGITAFQMDIKIPGVSVEIMTKALEQAKAGRLHILNEMAKTISATATEMSATAPKITTFKVDVEKIGLIIGPGGKTINSISEKSGARVNIEEDGTVTIFSKEQKGAELAESFISALIEEPEVGRIYMGTVKRLMDFGAFIEILPGKEGLCHISRVSKDRVEDLRSVIKEEQEVEVRLIEVDRMGRLNLSIVDAQNPDWKPQFGNRK
ncbi:MAG: polyribonucleotide nucleotidyltransferase, partial [Spirochaetaceae bacterium]|nr:polyribonucleotide nucleotidyltransferase [Spirochaetaceae bacterium]